MLDLNYVLEQEAQSIFSCYMGGSNHPYYNNNIAFIATIYEENEDDLNLKVKTMVDALIDK